MVIENVTPVTPIIAPDTVERNEYAPSGSEISIQPRTSCNRMGYASSIATVMNERTMDPVTIMAGINQYEARSFSEYVDSLELIHLLLSMTPAIQAIYLECAKGFILLLLFFEDLGSFTLML